MGLTAPGCGAEKPGTGGLADDSGCAATRWYEDTDGDGFGTGPETKACVAPAGHTAMDGDCNDADASVHPGAPEECNGVDDDCDGVTDPESDLEYVDCYLDSDGDGYGTSGASLAACRCPDAYSTRSGDCDDEDASVHPEAAEDWYDGIDGDCNEDDDYDADGDGWRVDEGDCDDADSEVHPDANEVCGNGVDDDCDGEPGECGIKGWRWTEDADVSLMSNEFYSTLQIGSETADVSGDGAPGLLVGWASSREWSVDECSDHSAFLEFHIVDVSEQTGRREAVDLESESVASYEVPVDCTSWAPGHAASIGSQDLDGDGHADFILEASNESNSWRADPKRVYFIPGPASGETTLDGDDAYVEHPAGAEWFGGGWMSLLENGPGPSFQVVLGHSGDVAETLSAAVWFIDEAHFTGTNTVEGAATLWLDSGECASITDSLDVDGDGVSDLLAATGSGGCSTASPAVFLGPFDSDRSATDFDAVFVLGMTTASGLAGSARICPGASGDSSVVAAVRLGEDADGAELAVWEWAGGGMYGEADAQARIRAGTMSMRPASCHGDFDGDGDVELVVDLDDPGGTVSGGDAAAAILTRPASGTWDWNDLWTAGLAQADDVDPGSAASFSIGMPDLTGNGVSDLVVGLTRDPVGSEPSGGSRSRLQIHHGERDGL